jgi:hypothetical protein
MAIWVDDVFPVFPSSFQATFDADFATWQKQIAIRSLGVLSHALGIDFAFSTGQSIITMATYFTKLADKYGLQELNFHGKMPLPSNASYNTTATPLLSKEHTMYRCLVGELSYAAYTVRADLKFAVHFLARSLHAPTAEHLHWAYHALKYAISTKAKGLHYRRSDLSQVQLNAYTDSDWAADPTDRKSVLSSAIYAGHSLIYWDVTKGPYFTSLSTCESEFYAACETSKGILHVRNFLRELSHFGIIDYDDTKPTPLFIDNRAAKLFIESNRPTQRMRHVDLRHLFILDLRAAGIILPIYVSSRVNLADLNSKLQQVSTYIRLVDPFLGILPQAHPTSN